MKTRIVLMRFTISIPRGNLPAGMYFYKLIEENKEVIGIGKLLVE